MKIHVNGNETLISENLTILALVEEKRLNPDTVVIEHNLTIQPKEKWSQIILNDGDKLEIVAFVGGG